MCDDITEPHLKEIKKMVMESSAALAQHIDYTRDQFEEHSYTIKQNRQSVDKLASDFNDHRIQEDQDRLTVIEKLEQLQPVADAIDGIEAVAKFGNWFKKFLLWLTPVGAFFIALYEYLEHLRHPQ